MGLREVERPVVWHANKKKQKKKKKCDLGLMYFIFNLSVQFSVTRLGDFSKFLVADYLIMFGGFRDILKT